ncbi:PilZ domain-containing protein [Desulfonatronum zhilinae]|nr:PilZ domain-containing protein [Desulfonatronum zhilinae]
MSTSPHYQARREDRIAIDSVNLPFMGSRVEDSAIFQYLLMDISMHGARIVLPQWVVKREILHQGERIDFHLPFLFEGETFNQGSVAWATWDDNLGGLACGVRIDARTPLYYPVYVSFEGKSITIDLTDLPTAESLLEKILKDTILLKKGILIYLKHLKPILTRTTGYDAATLRRLRGFLFEDMHGLVLKNIEQLKVFRGNISHGVCSINRIQQVFDLEELREVMEPELDAAVWSSAFEQDVMRQYLAAIVTLEKKIFYNYNTLVMLYAHALAKPDPACPDH